jgi:NADPH-dependent glutamate synthase beta subunit-like oxidoreductase
MEPQGIKIPGTQLPGVLSALDMLISINTGQKITMGKRVAVIGGGDVAMDSVRSALRFGAEKVTLVYRRSREEMPASDEEIAETQAEGIEFMYLTAPLEVQGKDKVVGLKCQKMQLGEPDESGRRRPVPIPGSEFVLDVDTVILAIGQQPSLKGIPEIGIVVNKKGVIEGDPETGGTKQPGVYAGGGASVVHAMAAGRKAAFSIDRYLRPQAS